MAITDAKLDFWIEAGFNVLFEGRHGVGKTHIIIDAFTRNGLNWKYYSASTMDPWVDFIGVPKAMKDEGSDEEYLGLVLPKDFRDDQIEAIFLDEYNRAAKKVRNAVMELIQFKSINGRKFKKLKLVWVAVNPEDDDDLEYDVEPLDPAQKDRFHVQVQIPYRPSKVYFTKQYSKDISAAAVSWWETLPKEQKTLVSPRRLDYALMLYSKNGDMRDALPKSVNVTKLLTTMKTGPIKDALNKFITNDDKEGGKKFINVENNFTSASEIVTSSGTIFDFFLPLLSDEKISIVLSGKKGLIEKAISLAESNKNVLENVRAILRANKNQTVVRAIKRLMKKKRFVRDLINGSSRPRGSKSSAFVYNKNATLLDGGLRTRLSTIFTNLGSYKTHYTHARWALYDEVLTLIPMRFNTENGLLMLQILNQLAERSQVGTLVGKSTFMGTVNHIIFELCILEKCSYDALMVKHRRKSFYLRDKIERDGRLYNKLQQPTKVEIEAEISARTNKNVSNQIANASL